MLLVMLLMVDVQSNKHKFGGYRLVYTEYSQVFVRFFLCGAGFQPSTVQMPQFH